MNNKTVYFLKFKKHFLGADDKFNLPSVLVRMSDKSEVSAVSFDTKEAAEQKLASLNLSETDKKFAVVHQVLVSEKSDPVAQKAKRSAAVDQNPRAAKRSEAVAARAAKNEEKRAKRSEERKAKFSKIQAATQQKMSVMSALFTDIKAAHESGNHQALSAKLETLKETLAKFKEQAKARAAAAKAAQK